MFYELYIASEAWRTKRAARLEIDNHRCRGCGRTAEECGKSLEVHHRPDSYARIPNESVADDLTTLCFACHDAITNIIRELRYGARPLPPLVDQPKQPQSTVAIVTAIEIPPTTPLSQSQDVQYVSTKIEVPNCWAAPSDSASRRVGESQ